MSWFTRKQDEAAEVRSFDGTYTLESPGAFAGILIGGQPISGVNVNQYTAMGIPAVNCAVSLISGTLASLPLKAYRKNADGTKTRIPSFIDSDGTSVTQLTYFETIEMALVHLLLHR